MFVWVSVNMLSMLKKKCRVMDVDAVEESRGYWGFHTKLFLKCFFFFYIRTVL